MGKAPTFSGMPVTLTLYFCKRLSPFSTSKASGAEAQNISDVLLLAVSCRYLMPAVVFFFSISTLMPGCLASNAFLTVTVVSGG